MANSAPVEWVVPDTSWSVVGDESITPTQPAPAETTPGSTIAPLNRRPPSPPRPTPARDLIPNPTSLAAAPPPPVKPAASHPRAGHRRRRVAVTVLAGVIVGLGSASSPYTAGPQPELQCGDDIDQPARRDSVGGLSIVHHTKRHRFGVRFRRTCRCRRRIENGFGIVRRSCGRKAVHDSLDVR